MYVLCVLVRQCTSTIHPLTSVTPVADGSLLMATADEDAGSGAASGLQQNKRNIKAPHKT